MNSAAARDPVRATPPRALRLPAALVAFLCATVPARPDDGFALSAWQEIVVLTVAKAHHAADSCGFRIDAGQVGALLGAAAIGNRDIPPAALSPGLRRQIAADADDYLDNKEAACGRAWARFGADGAPGVRDLLTQ